jgi:hypothetical protein
MAGNAGNWFKAGVPGVKTKVFISNATLAKMWPDFADELDKLKYQFHAKPALYKTEILKMAAASPQPANQAKRAGKDLPPGWADDPRAANLIAIQADPKVMLNSGNPGDKLINTAFLAANPTLPVYNRNDSIQNAELGVQALYEYAGAAYDRINNTLWSTLRGTDGVMAVPTSFSEVGTQINALQDLLLRGIAPFNMTVTRAVSTNHALALWANTANVGDPYVNLGFDSSSINPDITVHGNNVQLRMRIPAGSRGASVNAILDIGSSEQEWLVPANSSWVVTGRRVMPNGKLEVTVDLIDQRAFDGTVVWP